MFVIRLDAISINIALYGVLFRTLLFKEEEEEEEEDVEADWL